MRTLPFFLVCMFVLCSRLAAAEPEQLADSKELRDQCHAHTCYTAALAEQDSKARMILLNKTIELNPKLARAYYNRGVLYVKKNDLARARADFEKAAALDEGHIYAHYNLACVLSLDGQLDEAQKSLEKAIDRGYRKFDKLADDADLKLLRERPGFGTSLARSQDRVAKTELTGQQRFQTAGVAERAKLLMEGAKAPNKQSADLARWAMQEPDPEMRVLAVQLLRKLKADDSRQALIYGLYDSHGSVSKAAANALVDQGKAVEKHLAWILADKGTPAPFYAVQVLAGIDARGSIDKMVPLLADEDPRVRTMAAESLARLHAVSALPQMEAALQNLPKDQRKQDFYKASITNALERLRKIKESGQK